MNVRDLTRHRLHNLQVSQTQFKTPEDLVQWLGAVQSQDYGGAKWALGLRLKNVSDNDIEQAFDDGRILRTHVMRPTWHFVTPQDIRWMLELTSPRLKALCATSFRKLGLDEQVFRKSNAIITKVLHGNNYSTREEIAARLKNAGIAINDQRLVHLLMRAELDALICSGPRKEKQFTYALLAERASAAKKLDRQEALATLAARYLASHGPAAVKDFAWWSGLTVADASAGIESVGDQFVQETVDGVKYWLPPLGQPAPDAVYLLPNYDEYIIAYKDRTAMLDPAVLRKVDQRDNILFNNVLIVNGRVEGAWKRKIMAKSVELSVMPFTKLGKVQEKKLNDAIKNYSSFLNLPVTLA